MKTPKQAATYRLTPLALDLLTKLARRGGTSKTAVLEGLIRKEAKEQGVWK